MRIVEESLQSTYASVLWKEARLEFLLSTFEEGTKQEQRRSSRKGRGTDALAPGAEERRDKLRKAAGSCK